MFLYSSLREQSDGRGIMPCGQWHHKLHTEGDKIFPNFEKDEWRYLTIAGRDTVIVGTGRAIFTLPSGTQVKIEDALLYPDSSRT